MVKSLVSEGQAAVKINPSADPLGPIYGKGSRLHVLIDLHNLRSATNRRVAVWIAKHITYNLKRFPVKPLKLLTIGKFCFEL